MARALVSALVSSVGLLRPLDFSGPAGFHDRIAKGGTSTDSLYDAQQLALEVIRRLESDEALSRILAAARRLAETWGQRDAAFWLYLESVGLQTGKRDWSEMDEDEREGWRRFMRGRQTVDVNAVASSLSGSMPKKWAERDHVMSTSIAEIERISRPAALTPPVYDEGVARHWAMGELIHGEGQRVLEVVRTNVHRFATALDRLIGEQRLLLEMFGPDCFTVFQAGGPLLDQLKNTPKTLQQAGAYLAAQEARTTVLRMNKDLYKGERMHTSPLDHKTRDTSLASLSRLRAFLDNLWTAATDEKRKDLIRRAMDEVEEAYDLGSKAKDPTRITYGEAVRAMQLTFNVARTIMLCGGFPLPIDAAATEPKQEPAT